MKTPENPPAFPAPEFLINPDMATPMGIHRVGMTRGMTLRDFFAAAALPSIRTQTKSAKTVAKFAYDIADAMLTAREAGNNTSISVNAGQQLTARVLPP